MENLKFSPENWGLGNVLTEEQRQKRQADLSAFEKREQERERERRVYSSGQRLKANLKFKPPARFGPDWVDTKDGKPILEYGVSFASFDSRLQPRAYQLALDFANGTPKVPGLLLIGPVGTGKTHLAAAIYNNNVHDWAEREIKHKFQTLFITETKLLAEVKATYQAEATQSEENVIDLFSSCQLLILDDLCKYEAADPRFRNRILFEIVDRLWSGGRKLVATSNYALPELTQMLGEPIADRLRDMCVVVEMKGKSQRGKVAPPG